MGYWEGDGAGKEKVGDGVYRQKHTNNKIPFQTNKLHVALKKCKLPKEISFKEMYILFVSIILFVQ